MTKVIKKLKFKIFKSRNAVYCTKKSAGQPF